MSDLIKLKFKILLIGDTGVGKSSILLKYMNNCFFHETHIATIGVEFKTKIITKGKYKINLNIWNSAGQGRFKSIPRSFYSGATGIIFVYDITKRETFSSIRNWIKDIEDYKVERILCGNKRDLDVNRSVKLDELKEYSIKSKIDIMETSAKTGENIIEAFDKLIDNIIKNRTEDELIRDFGIKNEPKRNNLINTKTGQKSKCYK